MKKRRKKKQKVNLILSHVNHTFLISDPQIGPQAFRHTHCVVGKSAFSNVKESLIQGSIWSMGFWSLNPYLKWP
jgi:hypothetical protein